jgi:hypothetical protein
MDHLEVRLGRQLRELGMWLCYGVHVLAIHSEDSNGEGGKVANGVQVWYIHKMRGACMVPKGALLEARLSRQKLQERETELPARGY